MNELIDQIIGRLHESSMDTRSQDRVYQALSAVVRSAVDDSVHAQRFSISPSRADRMPHQSTDPSDQSPSRRYELDISGGQVGVAASEVHGGVQTGGQRFEAAVQFFFGEQPATDRRERELLAAYLNSLIITFSPVGQPKVMRQSRATSPIPPDSLRRIYMTMASEEWVKASDTDAQEPAGADQVLPDHARRRVSVPSNLDPKDLGATATPRADRQLERPRLLTEVVSECRHVVILGKPGSGKSTFLRYLAIALAQAGAAAQGTPPDLPGWSAGLLIPLFGSLAGFAAKLQARARQPSPSDIWRYLLSVNETDVLHGLKEPLGQAFRDGKLLLLLDGLEEIADPTMRADTAGAIAALAEQSNSFVVVTCRDRSFDGPVREELQKWGEPARMAKLSIGQMRYFVREWYRGVSAQGELQADQGQRRADDLIYRLMQWPNWHDLIQGPYFLGHICELHSKRGWVPENRAALYRDSLGRLLERWEQRPEPDKPLPLLAQLKEDRTLGSLTADDLRRCLAALAYRARKSAPLASSRGLLDRGVVRETFLSLFGEFGLDIGLCAQKSQYVLDRLLADDLLQEAGAGVYHLSEYESYLAARYLIDQRGQRPDTLMLAYSSWRESREKWSEVIFLALQQLVLDEDSDTVAKWLQLLIAEEHGTRKRTRKERADSTLFAAECLEKLGGPSALQGVSTMSLSDLWSDLIQALIDVIKSACIPTAARVQAGFYLCRLGDRRQGVCTPLPSMIWLEGGSFRIGSCREEAQRLIQFQKDWSAQQDRPWSPPALWMDDQRNDEQAQLVVPPFEIARYPVTNAQYMLFVEGGGYDPRQPWWDDAGRAWLLRNEATITAEHDPIYYLYRRRSSKDRPEFWDTQRFGEQLLTCPVVGVTWYEALAFCRWLTQHKDYNRKGSQYRLPSEVEWEFAARGVERRRFPWGDEEADDEHANFYRRHGGTTPVGCFPAGATPTGIYDLAGNVYEWTSSLFRPYPYDPADGYDHAADPSERGVIVRGGGWSDPLIALFPSSRSYFLGRGAPPDCFFDKLGFRLARSVRA